MATIKINGYEITANIEEIQQLIKKPNQPKNTPLPTILTKEYAEAQKVANEIKKIKLQIKPKCLNCGKNITGKNKEWKKYGFCTKICAKNKNQNNNITKKSRKDTTKMRERMIWINTQAKKYMQTNPNLSYHQARKITVKQWTENHKK